MPQVHILPQFQDFIKQWSHYEVFEHLICFFTYRLMLTNIFICHTPVDGERLLHQK